MVLFVFTLQLYLWHSKEETKDPSDSPVAVPESSWSYPGFERGVFSALLYYMPIMPGHVEYLLQALFDHCINKDPRQGVSANHMDSAAVKQYCDRYSYGLIYMCQISFVFVCTLYS